jgi:Asp/Glu/hydantoin racemase
MLTACMLGHRFGIVAFNPDLAVEVHELVRRYRLEDRAVPVQMMTLSYDDIAGAFDQPAPFVEAFTEASRLAIAAGADVIIPGQALMSEVLFNAGLTRIGDHPVLDSRLALIRAAQTMVALHRSGIEMSRAGFYQSMPPATLVKSVRGTYLKS